MEGKNFGMELRKAGCAGTLESSDIMITIHPGNGEGIEIVLESPAKQQFGKAINSAITESLMAIGVHSALVEAKDRGALDCTIKARTETAALRAAEMDDDEVRAKK